MKEFIYIAIGGAVLYYLFGQGTVTPSPATGNVAQTGGATLVNNLVATTTPVIGNVAAVPVGTTAFQKLATGKPQGNVRTVIVPRNYVPTFP